MKNAQTKGLAALLGEAAAAYGAPETVPAKRKNAASESGEVVRLAVKKSAIQAPEKEPRAADEGVVTIPLSLVDRNESQPRKFFDEEKLAELAASIRQHGIIQPVVLVKKGERYTIIAGERRVRAARLAGLDSVPAVVRSYDEEKIREIAIIENLQREDLNPVEAASAIRELMEEHRLTQEEVSEKIGKSRSAVANLLRILNLSGDVLTLVRAGRLSVGHARTLCVVTDQSVQLTLALRACDNKMSVRELEAAIKNLESDARKVVVKSVSQPSREIRDLVNGMQYVFGTKVSLKGNEEKGKISIDYFSREDLERIYEVIERIR